MWRYNDSDSETASSTHCNYCGQTCANRRHLKNDLGVCNRCSRVLSHLTDTGNSNSNSRTMSARAKVSFASTAEDGDVGRSDETTTLGNLSEEENASDQEGESEVTLCPRCWKNPPTTKLYDVPICQGCLRQANEQKELPPGSRKRRFQPPTPALAPGKKLTKVCATCRKRRKRCPHRRVVDENDPEADPRSKRFRAQEKPNEGEEDGEESEVTLAAEISFTPVKGRDESEENESSEEDDQEDTEEVSRSSQSLGDDDAKEPDDYDCEETLKGAIRDSIDTVLGKEAHEMISCVQEKLDLASQELKTAKKSLGQWLSQRTRSKWIIKK